MLKGSSEAIPNENGIKDDKSEPKKNILEGTDDIDTQFKLKVEKKQHQVEEILKRKKDEEHLKRLKFEENRIREENERMKFAAEEKKKREEEDKKLQQEKESRLRQIEEQQKGRSKANSNSHGIPERKEENGLQQRNSELDIELPEEKALFREEDKIKTLNEEIFRGHIGPERRSPKPKAVEQYERLVTNKFSNEKCEKENIKHMTEKRNTQDELTLRIEELDDQSEVSFIQGSELVESPREDLTEKTKSVNRMLQKPRNNTEKELFRDLINDSGFSIASRWNNMSSGNVKGMANTFTRTEENTNFKSPQIRRKLLKPDSWMKKENENSSSKKGVPLQISKGINDSKSNESNAPWRRKDSVDKKEHQPTLNIVSVTITPSQTSKTEKAGEIDQKIHFGSTNIANIPKFQYENKSQELFDKSMQMPATVTESNKNTIMTSLAQTTEKCETSDSMQKKEGIRLSRERSFSPITKTKQAAEEELDETIRQLEIHVEALGDVNKESLPRIYTVVPVDPEDFDSDGESVGYEDDFSVGIDLPANADITSGRISNSCYQNYTPKVITNTSSKC